jgi:chromosome segregation ATPase
MNPAIEETRAQLAQLEAAEAADERQQLVDQLRAVRQDLQTKRRQFPKIKASFTAKSQDVDNARGAINRADDAISDSLAERPRVADVLPDDEEVVAWRKEHTRLEARRAELVTELQALPDPEPSREEAVQLNHDIIRLEFSEQNLMRRLDGGGFAVAGGVVSGVR